MEICQVLHCRTSCLIPYSKYNFKEICLGLAKLNDKLISKMTPWLLSGHCDIISTTFIGQEKKTEKVLTEVFLL